MATFIAYPAEMLLPHFILTSGGTPFQDGDDHGRVLVSGHDTDGRYSVMEYVVAPGSSSPSTDVSYGPHRHAEIEETFLVRKGRLQFLLDDQLVELGPGDFVKVPPGTRHGFANLSDQPAELLVTFVPGGFEQLFLRHRTDQDPPPRANGFVEDATREFGSEFEP